MNRTDKAESVTHNRDEQFAYFENSVRNDEAFSGAIDLLIDMKSWADEVALAKNEPVATREITSFEFVASAVRKALSEDLRLELVSQLGKIAGLAQILSAELKDVSPPRQARIT